MTRPYPRPVRPGDASQPGASLRLVSSCQSPARPAPQNRGFAPLDGWGRHREAGRPLPLPTTRAWRENFPRVWQAFLHDHFGGDPEVIAAAFQVRTQTARNWVQALHCPNGWVVSWAMMRWRAEIAAAALRLGVR